MQRPLRPVETLDAATLGGRHDLLLFADPALTEGSAFALGDRRRPQDIVLLSPILARWGFRLEFDAEQAAGEHAVAMGEGVAVPVNLPGSFAAVAGGRTDAVCRIEAEALLAECRIGRGRVLAIADAALFERVDDPAIEATRSAVLDTLLARAF